MTGWRIYWAIWASVAFATFIIPEVIALVTTHGAGTLSVTIWDHEVGHRPPPDRRPPRPRAHLAPRAPHLRHLAGVALIVVPFVAGLLEPATRAWADANKARLQFLGPEDDAYWRFLADEWRYPWEALVIVEQDVVPAPGAVDGMAACERPWCVSPYQLGTGVWLEEGLGCTKFSARLRRDFPELLEAVGTVDADGAPAKDWHRLDTRIAAALKALGYTPHIHRRSLHLHDYSKRP